VGQAMNKAKIRANGVSDGFMGFEELFKRERM
jgi:hypothetical protein